MFFFELILGHFVNDYILNLYYDLNLPQDQIIWKWKKNKIQQS